MWRQHLGPGAVLPAHTRDLGLGAYSAGPVAVGGRGGAAVSPKVSHCPAFSESLLREATTHALINTLPPAARQPVSLP